MATKRCPVCDVPVKLENLERHVRNQHPRANVDLEAALTSEERRQASEARAVRRPGITRRGKQVIAVVAIALAVILVLVVLNPFRSIGPGVGQEAPDFRMQTSTGGAVTLSAFRSVWVVLLEFMDADCSHCHNEAPILVSLYANFSSQVRFVSVDANIVPPLDDNAKIEAFKSLHGISWEYALDSTHSVTNAYGVSSTPTTFVVDRTGIVRAVHVGENTYAAFAAALIAALGA